MKQNNINFFVADNSGVKIIKQIRTNTNEKTITCCIKKTITTSKIKKGSIALAKIIKKKNKTQRINGTFIKFKNRAVILVLKDKHKIRALGTRSKGCYDRNFNFYNSTNNLLLPNINQY